MCPWRWPRSAGPIRPEQTAQTPGTASKADDQPTSDERPHEHRLPTAPPPVADDDRHGEEQQQDQATTRRTTHRSRTARNPAEWPRPTAVCCRCCGRRGARLRRPASRRRRRRARRAPSPPPIPCSPPTRSAAAPAAAAPRAVALWVPRIVPDAVGVDPDAVRRHSCRTGPAPCRVAGRRLGRDGGQVVHVGLTRDEGRLVAGLMFRLVRSDAGSACWSFWIWPKAASTRLTGSGE